jgi:hypothetical protein
VSTAVTSVEGASIISRATALKELRQSSDITGVFSNISDEEIEEAEGEEPPGAEEAIEPNDEPDQDPVEQEQNEAEPALSVVAGGKK